LDQPRRFVYVLLRPQWRSWLVRGAFIITAYAASLFGWLILELLNIENLVFDGIVIGLAAATAVYTAFLFAQAKARDFWQSPMLGVHMLIHACLAGGSIYLAALPFASSSDWIHCIRVLTTIAILARLACDALELGTTHATADASRTAEMIVRGYYARWYWLGVVAIGAILPLIVLWVGPTALSPIAAVAIWIGIYVSEHIWVRAPQRIALA
jgi:formate-dependent nitrite reductase membrane component NrfD